MGELHPSVKVKGELHIRPGQCVKVKVNRLHCKALLISSVLQSQEVGMGQQDFQVLPTGLAAKNLFPTDFRYSSSQRMCRVSLTSLEKSGSECFCYHPTHCSADKAG